jgi:hypothetical protein
MNIDRGNSLTAHLCIGSVACGFVQSSQERRNLASWNARTHDVSAHKKFVRNYSEKQRSQKNDCKTVKFSNCLYCNCRVYVKTAKKLKSENFMIFLFLSRVVVCVVVEIFHDQPEN